jgi:flavin-dependent dehydrogenase
VYWSRSNQIYVAPVGDEEIGAAVLCENPRTRLADALESCPALKSKLQDREPSTREMGALTTFERLRRVTAPGLALIGDASGSVDSSTGDGMCLAFLEAHALAEAVANNDLSSYEREHRRINRRSRCMSQLFLFAARYEKVRDLFFKYLQKEPERFDYILGIHIGEKSPRNLIGYELASALQRVRF